MKFTLTIESDNAAFSGDDLAPVREVARIVSDLGATLVDRFEVTGGEGTVRDVNGNTVGGWTLEVAA